MNAPRIAGLAAAIVVGLGAVSFLYHRASMVPEPMELAELNRIARQLASDARESQRLAALVATGQVNEHYAKAQHEKLAEDLGEARKKLDEPPPQGRTGDAKRMEALVERMNELLADAPSKTTDRAAMTALAGEHGRIAAELEQLARP